LDSDVSESSYGFTRCSFFDLIFIVLVEFKHLL